MSLFRLYGLYFKKKLLIGRKALDFAFRLVFPFPQTTKDHLGFTIIELLMVITIIGIVSGVTLTTINVQRQREIAQDGVLRENLQKVSEAVESYRILEGTYPESCSDVPTNCSGNDALDELVDNWPADIEYVTDSDESEFAVYANSVIDDEKYYKYSSDWSDTSDDDGSMQECGADQVDTVGGCSEVGSEASGSPSGPTLTAILLSPTSPTPQVNVGSTIAFTPTGRFSDGSTGSISTPVSWAASNSNATVSSGVAAGVTAGTTNITATSAGVSGAVRLIVNPISAPTSPPAPDSVQVSSGSGTDLSIGGSTAVTACFSDDGGPCTNITLNTGTQWESSNTSVLSVTRLPDRVMVTGVSLGTADVRATYQGVTGSLTFTVSGETASRVLDRIAILPSSNPVNIALGGTMNFVARAYYTDGYATNVTGSAEWEITSGADKISFVQGSTSNIRGDRFGTGSIRATFTDGGVTKSADKTINVM